MMTVIEQTAHAVVAHMDEGQKRALVRFDAKGTRGISDYRKAQLTSRDLITERGGDVVVTEVGAVALQIIQEGRV